MSMSDCMRFRPLIFFCMSNEMYPLDKNRVRALECHFPIIASCTPRCTWGIKWPRSVWRAACQGLARSPPRSIYKLLWRSLSTTSRANLIHTLLHPHSRGNCNSSAHDGYFRNYWLVGHIDRKNCEVMRKQGCAKGDWTQEKKMVKISVDHQETPLFVRGRVYFKYYFACHEWSHVKYEAPSYDWDSVLTVYQPYCTHKFWLWQIQIKIIFLKCGWFTELKNCKAIKIYNKFK